MLLVIDCKDKILQSNATPAPVSSVSPKTFKIHIDYGEVGK